MLNYWISCHDAVTIDWMLCADAETVTCVSVLMLCGLPSFYFSGTSLYATFKKQEN